MDTGSNVESARLLRMTEGSRERTPSQRELDALEPREPAITWLPFLFVAGAILAMVPGGHPLDPILAVGAVVSFVAAEQVKLPLTAGYADNLQTLGYASTLQPAFVLMMFAFPLNWVPTVALASMIVSSIVRNRSARYVTTAVADSWFAIVPVVMLSLLAPGPASWSHWLLYVAVFAGEFGADMILGAGRRAIHNDPVSDPGTLLLPLTIDILLTPVGLTAAVVGNYAPVAAVTLLVGVIGVMLLLGRERVHRIREAQRALHDPLTGLANRLLFFELLDAAARRCERADCEAALLLLDLDKFKQVNDTHGHQRGDEVLCAFADRVRASVRHADTVARLGGDEFAILLTEPADFDAADAVSRKLRDAFKTPLLLPDGSTLAVGVSIGAAVFDADAPLSRALAAADRALYADKRRAVMLPA